ncbi:MAG: LuxR C-terminal-related transcriptional regulator [Dehalococcoidia bacterium]|jgi:DNA-binding NarL/FixJ family response regulator|nr:LuxR C-terminal-related transcriptional regulator [Dehalococcoidia bacterium]
MTTLQQSARLEAALTELADIETAILDAVHRLEDRVSPHPDVPALFADIERMAHDHLDAIKVRYRSLAGLVLQVGGTGSGSGSTGKHELADFHPVSSSLRALYTQLNEAVIAYSTLTLMAVRFRDSWVAASEGTTAHIGRAYTQEYMAAIGRITETIYDVVRWELDGEGLECQCTCPSCVIGICVGPAAIRNTFSEAWNAARPPMADTGIVVQPPRIGSAADEAGFRQGDVIVTADGAKVDSVPVLQKVVKSHLPHEWIEFGVLRNGDVIPLIAERRSDLDVELDMNVEDCVQAPGSDFYQDRARDIQARVRENGSTNGSGPTGLASLSPREIQVLRLAAEGAHNPEIAESLGIKRATVARHIANILEKLGAANRTEAVSIAATGGLLSYA